MYQQLMLIGNLGRDPEMRYTPSGVPVTTFSVAVNKRWTGQDGAQQEKTTWFRVTAWRKTAELCNEYLRKGAKVMITGEVDASAYTAQDGAPRAALEVTARDVRFLSSATQGGEYESSSLREAPPTEEEEIPF
ncbi:MAG: single-stranded DNA-binding protein [Caldilineales bacterium]|nr:single-stranded DNA-binding protein [Caldilineales bacterium]